MNDLFDKRTYLINDYISQILVYGTSINGTLGINNNLFSDGTYLILTVSVLQNSYFRWHDLGIKIDNRLAFYKYLVKEIFIKFKEFDIRFTDNSLIVSSKVNNNQIELSFTLIDDKDKKWFESIKKKFYNEIK